MRIKSFRYRKWKKHQNEKKLKYRSKKKKLFKLYITKQIQYNSNLNMNRTYTFNRKTRGYEFHAPLNFSLINNTAETINFFNKILIFANSKKNSSKKIFFDLSQITQLTIDALMYLLAIMDNISKTRKHSLLGNSPLDKKIYKIFSESGFYNFVKTNEKNCSKKKTINQNNDNIQIMSGEKNNTQLAKKLSDFICNKANVKKKRIFGFLYSMILELMLNTQKHAYNDDNNYNAFYPKWYCFAEYDRKNTISFSFMDTGVGIPTTVRKDWHERFYKRESEYVISALDGDFRTATLKSQHGKGLPQIRNLCTNKKIINLHIITSKANIKVFEKDYQSQDTLTPLRGTLYYWQIDIKNFLEKEDK